MFFSVATRGRPTHTDLNAANLNLQVLLFFFLFFLLSIIYYEE